MSRLVRTGRSANSGPKEQKPQAPLTQESIVEHLKKCQNIAVELARQSFQYFLQDLDEAFNLEMDKARSNQEVNELTGVQRLFVRNRPELERYYCGYIAEGFVKFKKHELHTELQDSSDQRLELSLVDNDDLEETITLSSIVQKIESDYAEPIWALNQRFAILNGGAQVIEASNPATPIQLCESLRRALRLITLSARVKGVVYRVYEQRMPEMSKAIIEDINGYLKNSGILPNLRYTTPQATKREQRDAEATVGTSTGAAPAGMEQIAFVQPDPNQPTEQYQSALLQAIRGLQISMAGGAQQAPVGRSLSDHLSGLEAAGGQAHPFAVYVPGGFGTAGPSGNPGAGAGGIISPEQIMAALQSVQSSAQQNVAANAAMGSLNPVQLEQVLAAVAQQFENQDIGDGKVANEDMNAIDLVGMVFEFMLKDENLPDNIKALLSYLHTPFLKLAFIDRGFFEQPEHPARMLLNALAEAGTRWVGNDGTAQHDMYNRIKGVVNSVLSEFKNDVRVIAELLLEFNNYTKNLVRRQELMEKRAAEKAQGEEKLKEVKVRVNKEVGERIKSEELPSAVLLFALQPWSDYLSFLVLRYGEKSERFKLALRVLDDLLWLIEPKMDPSAQIKQQEILEATMKEIETGFETIGYEQVKGQKLIDALNEVVELAQQKKKAEPAPAPMRDQLEKIAAEKAGQTSVEELNISEEEQKVVENLKMIEFGTWFEFDGGQRLKIAWYNGRTSQYMLVDQMGKKVAMMSGLEIARKMIAKQAKIIAGSSKPFFERALENIFQKLNAQAEAQSGGNPG